jgi:hypothetical protein
MTDPTAAAYPSPPDYASPPDQRSFGALYEGASMSSSGPPDPYAGKQPAQGSYGGVSGTESDKSPLSTLNLGFLRSLTDKKITRGV